MVNRVIILPLPRGRYRGGPEMNDFKKEIHMSKKTLTHAEAIAANGGRPLTQTEKFRHPYTGEYITDIDKWRDPITQIWYETKYNAAKKEYEPIVPTPAVGTSDLSAGAEKTFTGKAEGDN